MEKLLDTFDTFVSHPLTLILALLASLIAGASTLYLTQDVQPGAFAMDAAAVTSYQNRPLEAYSLRIAYVNQ